MEGLIKKESQGENFYEKLKKSFLAGEISFSDVRDELLKIDQSTYDRAGAEENLNFLKDEQIFDFVSKSKEDFSIYQKFFSLTLFHLGQNLAFRGDQKATSFIKEALESAVLGRADESWVSYLNSTLLYLEGVKIPDDLITKVDQDKNRQILEKLNKGLEERGFPDYSKDY